MTQERPPPARPWYELVIREIALRGWAKTELSERSGVARTTIDNWSTNRRRPRAKAVNAVADALGIDRAKAHVLAGIVTPEEPEPPTTEEMESLRAHIRRVAGPGSKMEAALDALERGDPSPRQRAGDGGGPPATRERPAPSRTP